MRCAMRLGNSGWQISRSTQFVNWSRPQSNDVGSGRQRRNVAGWRSQRPESPVVMDSSGSMSSRMSFTVDKL
jgi:hypothetical protein